MGESGGQGRDPGAQGQPEQDLLSLLLIVEDVKSSINCRVTGTVHQVVMAESQMLGTPKCPSPGMCSAASGSSE